MILALFLLSACSSPCEERAGVYSLLDDNGLEWNLRMSPGTTQFFNGKTMEYTLGVQVPARDASAFVLSDRFDRQSCREERVLFSAPLRGSTDVDWVSFNDGEVSGEIDRRGNLYLSYQVNLIIEGDLQPLAAEVTVPRVSSVQDWTGDTGDSWF